MKRKNLLSLLLVGLLSLGLASCGKDNEAGDPVVSGSNPIGAADPNFTQSTCQSSSNFQDFKNKVHSGQFVTENYEQESYYYERFQPDQGEFWIFTTYSLDKIGSFQRYSVRGQETVSHEKGTTKSQVLGYLKSLVDNAVNFRGQGSYYEVLHSNGMIYGINLCSSIAANPVFEGNQQSGEYYVYRYGSNNSFSYPYSGF